MIGTTAGLIAYAAARGVSIATDEAPILLVKATDYMNSFKWTGKKPAGQEDSWPRTDLEYNGTPFIDADGDEITTIEDEDGNESDLEEGDTLYSPPVTPKTIITATYLVAKTIGEGTDVQEVSVGGKIKQERVEGAITVIYADGTESNPLVIPGFSGLIEDWLLAPISSGANFPVARG